MDNVAAVVDDAISLWSFRHAAHECFTLLLLKCTHGCCCCSTLLLLEAGFDPATFWSCRGWCGGDDAEEEVGGDRWLVGSTGVTAKKREGNIKISFSPCNLPQILPDFATTRKRHNFKNMDSFLIFVFGALKYTTHLFAKETICNWRTKAFPGKTKYPWYILGYCQ